MSRRGFTLIELLVVIAIIGMLATFAVVQFNGARGKARDAKRKSDLITLQKALELYYASNNAYPITGAWRGVCSAYGGDSTSGPTGYIPNLAPAYIGVLPVDPRQASMPANKCYIYRSDGQGYKLMAYQTAETNLLPTSDPFYPGVWYEDDWTFAVCSPPGSAACNW